jgi:hypothetical protein
VGVETKSFAVGVAGTVTVSHGWDTLTLDEVVTNSGWSYRVDTLDSDQIDITFSHSDGDATFTAQLDQGSLQIDIDPGDVD